jgi:hypothetical protein
MIFKPLCLATLAVLGLCGCAKPGTEASPAWTATIIGPDMQIPGPFGSHTVHLTADEPAATMRIDIRPGATPDTAEEATLTGVFSDTKTYLAGVTWHAFTPIVAETNATRMDYWIVGLNLSRTPDRSIYAVLRFPHGADVTTTGAKVEYALLSCDDLGLARRARFGTVSLDPAPKPEAGDCEFNSLKEAYLVTPKVLKAYDRIHREKDAPTLSWEPLKVSVD